LAAGPRTTDADDRAGPREVIEAEWERCGRQQ
jgi:hypothetical protein